MRKTSAEKSRAPNAAAPRSLARLLSLAPPLKNNNQPTKLPTNQPNKQTTDHGWEFDGAGACVRIPQLGELGAPAPTPSSSSSDGAADTRPRPALAAKRSCLTSYPSSVEQGLLWVWADPSTPQAEADAAPRCSLEDFRGADADAELARRSTTAGWFVRDLPASFEATIENGETDCWS